MKVKLIIASLLFSTLSAFNISYAALSDLGIRESIGNIDGLAPAYIFVTNLIVWIGWIGVIIGVVLAGFATINKFISSDSEKSQELFAAYMTRAFVIVVIGLILINALFIVNVASTLFGGTQPVDLTNPSVLQ